MLDQYSLYFTLRVFRRVDAKRTRSRPRSVRQAFPSWIWIYGVLPLRSLEVVDPRVVVRIASESCVISRTVKLWFASVAGFLSGWAQVTEELDRTFKFCFCGVMWLEEAINKSIFRYYLKSCTLISKLPSMYALPSPWWNQFLHGEAE